ncbi:MAG: hypothetical protein ACLQBB_10300 [Solirubrobacteraceae bacterium]
MRGRGRVFSAPGRPSRVALAPSLPRRALPILLGGALALAGCGGGTRQDASEPAANFRVRVVHASFPALQSIARHELMVLAVRNTSLQTIPNLAVTVDSFNYTSNYPELAANKRPVWVIERGPGTIAKPPVQSEEVSTPGSGQTNYVNTWALGPLAPGRTRVFAWHVVPVKGGLHVVHYRFAAGLAGKATASFASGAPATGAFLVHIAGQPPPTHVDPATGKVVEGAYPASP